MGRRRLRRKEKKAISPQETKATFGENCFPPPRPRWFWLQFSPARAQIGFAGGEKRQIAF